MLELFNTINNAFCNFFGINSYLQGVIIMMCVNIIAVLGMSVLTGFTRLFSFGNAGFMSIGAYFCALITLRIPGIPGFLLGVLAGGTAAAPVSYTHLTLPTICSV